MSRTLKAGRFLSLAATLALVMGSTAPFAGTVAASGHEAKIAAKANVHSVATDVVQSEISAKGENRAPGDITLAHDGWTDEGLSYVQFTTLKAMWGEGFRLTADQSPFTLTQAVILIIASNEGTGLTPGEAFEIVILADASASGNPNNARVIHRQNEVVKEPGDGSAVFPLTTPVTVSQGDIYIAARDLSTDAEGTAIPYFPSANGASNQHQSYYSSNGGNSFSLWDELTFSDGTHPDGNFIIRGLGAKAAPGTPNTGYGDQPVDTTLPTITNLTGIASKANVTLSWTPPTLPEPNITNVNEQEPNNSPATAHDTGVNVLVSGKDRSSNVGSPGGFCDGAGTCDDVEDWFTFELASPSPVQIDLEDFGNNDFDLLIYDADGPFDGTSHIGNSGGAAGVEEHVNFPVLAAGRYYVAVAAFDPGVNADTNYKLRIKAAPAILGYNIFGGSSEGFTPSAANWLGTAGGAATSLTIVNAAPGSFFKISYIAGASQSGPSNAAAGGACTGGPTISTAIIKSKKGGSIKLTGSGFTTTMTMTIDGVAPTGYTIKIKGAKATIKPLNGLTLVKGSVVTLQVISDAGCTSVSNITVK